MCYLAGRLLEGLNERESLRYYERSKTLLENLVVTQPNAPQHRADLARTYQSMVPQLSRAGRPAEAEAAQSRSLSLREALVTESPNFPQYRGELALILSERAGAIAKQQPAETDKMFQRAIDLSLGLVREFPEVVINYQVLALNLKDWARYVLVDGSPEQKEQFERTAKDFIGQAADASMGAKVQFLREQLVLARRDLANKGLLGNPEKPLLQAVADLNELARDFPKEPKYVEMAGHSSRILGFITRDAGRPDDALKHFDQGFAAFQKLVDANDPAKDVYYRRYLIDTLLEKVAILAAAGRAEEAEKTSRQVLEMYESLAREYPKDVELRQKAALAVSGLVALLTKSGRQEEVAEVYRQAIARVEESPDDSQVRIYRGTLHRDSGSLDEAIADYSWIIAKDPKLAEAWDLRGNCYLRKGEFAKGAEDYSQVIKLQPDRWEAWNGRAAAYFHLQRWDRSVADYSKAIELAPEVHTNWLHRGHCYLQLAQWDKAAADFTTVTEGWPDDSGSWYLRGLAHAQLNQPEKAIADLRQAITRGYKDVESMKNEPKLAPLRSHDEFKKLLTAFDNKQK
jgi:tetratricopeptide (TPR) repeat protein